jgi:membrane protein implicated in regulation of membrane protease activity
MAGISEVPLELALSGVGFTAISIAAFLFHRAWQGEEVAAEWEEERRESKHAETLFVVVDTLRGWNYSPTGRRLVYFAVVMLALAAIRYAMLR